MVDDTRPKTFSLLDLLGEEILLPCYASELVFVRVIKEKKIDGRTQILVKWLGLRDAFYSWIDRDAARSLMVGQQEEEDDGGPQTQQLAEQANGKKGENNLQVFWHHQFASINSQVASQGWYRTPCP